MGYFSDEQILSLISASEHYRDAIDVPTIEPSDPKKLKYAEFSAILQGKGWDKGDYNDEEFVLGYILNEDNPARLDFLDILDEEVPEEYLPKDPYIATTGDILTKGIGRMASNMWAVVPAMAATELKVGELEDTGFVYLPNQQAPEAEDE